MAARKKVAKRWSVKSALLWVALVAVLVAAGFAALEPATRTIYHQLYPRSYRSYVEQYSREYDVDENLVYAVAKVESNFDPNAVSSADARGLMQMTEDAFEWVQYRMGDESGVTYADIFDPEVAIKYGTYMLHLLLTETGDEMLAICSYHAGMGNVSAWLEQENYSKDGKTLDKIPYSDTEWYYNKVSEAKEIYRELYS